jgi:hypothetical protein
MPQLTDHLLFAMIEIGATALEQELRAHAPVDTLGGWQRFTESLSSRAWEDAEAANDLLERLVKWQQEIEPLNW